MYASLHSTNNFILTTSFSLHNDYNIAEHGKSSNKFTARKATSSAQFMLSLISPYVTRIYFLSKQAEYVMYKKTLPENFKTVWIECRSQVVLAVKKNKKIKTIFCLVKFR